MGIYYRLASQEEEVDEALGEITNTSKHYEMVLMGEFNFPDICWKNSTAKHNV